MHIGSRVIAALRRALAGETTGAQGPRAATKERKRLQERVTAGVLFGLVGMITGTLGLYIAWQTAREEEAVVLSAYPTASPSDLTHAGLGIRVQVVNTSLRPVIVRKASLWVDGSRISEATGYLEDVRVLDRSTVEPAAITDSRRDFPISLSEREGRSLAILMDVWRPIIAADTAEIAATARQSLNQFLTSVGSLTSGEGHRIELGLELSPGGFQRFRIGSLVEPAIYPEAIRDANAIQRQAPLQNWLVDPLVERRQLVGLGLRRKFAGAGQVDLVQLDIWRERALFHRAFRRPVLGQQEQIFPLPKLPTGDYVATFTLNGSVVASRSFGLPWRGTRCGPARPTGPVWCSPVSSRSPRAQG